MDAMGTKDHRIALGWSAVSIAVELPLIALVQPYTLFESYDFPWVLLWALAVAASIISARVLSKWWYWLTGF
jgi:hypothetical protein